MKTLVVANQKGGVGKTSTLVHIAFDFAERGLRVLVIDLDTQGNASFTLAAYASGTRADQLFTPGVKSVQNSGVGTITLVESNPKLADIEQMGISAAGTIFIENLRVISEKFDVCLIDTAPFLGVAMTAAMLTGDFVLSPIELEAYSIQGIQKMLKTMQVIRSHNQKLKFLGMMPSKVDSRNPRHKQHLEDLYMKYPDLLIPHTIGLRSSIADALATGIPVWKMHKTAARKAAKEVRAVSQFVFDQMGVKK